VYIYTLFINPCAVNIPSAIRSRLRWVTIAVLNGSTRNLPQGFGPSERAERREPGALAENLAHWMTERTVAPASGKDAKVALLRNRLLFGRLKAGRVPTTLYSAEDGRVIMRAGVAEM
jgi:hypothetical protein